MLQNLAPKWIVYLLAGTYWRIWGHPKNGIDCYRNSLSRVPDEYKDVVLTNLASLIYKSGGIDDALLIMKDVVSLHNDMDPDVNFFIGSLYAAKVSLWIMYQATT